MSDTVSPPGASYQLIVGPLVIGVVANALVFGVCVMQLIAYSRSGYNDNRWILGMLCWTYVIDAFQVCTSVSMLWRYVVTNFANPAALTSAPWEYATVPVFSSVAPVPIHFFMAYRIMRFSQSRLLFVYISALSLGQAVLACASAAQGLLHTAIQSHIVLVPIADTWIIVSVLCDVSITGLLLYYLSKSRTGFGRTDSIISRICATTVKAAVPVTVVCTLDLCFLTAMPNNNLHYMFLLPVGRLYTNTVLSTLNERKCLRLQLENSTPNQQGIGLTMLASSRHHLRLQSTRVHGNVDDGIDRQGPLDLESMISSLRTMKADDGCAEDKVYPFARPASDQYVSVNTLLRGNGYESGDADGMGVDGEEMESVRVRFERCGSGK